MDEPTTPIDDPLARARDAAGRGDWTQALALLSAADAREPLGGAALAQLADTAYAAGRLDVTIDAWERAYAQQHAAGDALGAAAAAVRVAMHLLFDTALMAPVRGWIGRAERLVGADGETPVHAWLAVVRNYERLLSGDFDAARQAAQRAVEIGAVCEPAAAAVGRIAVARSLILGGEVADGVALLNDAGVAAVSGELEPLFTGLVYCELVCAFQALAQYDLAEQWTTAMERWCRGRPVGSLHGRCRVHRAEILRLRGCCAEAEQEALRACDELRPYLRRELGWPLTELGRIRLRRGDLRGAEAAFRDAHALGWDPYPGLALLQLAGGDLEAAAQGVRAALDQPLNVPSKEFPPHTELRRAPLLEAQVEIGVSVGDLDRARAAAAELARIGARFGSSALLASAAQAQGRVAAADGDTASALRHFDDALQRWNEIGAPYETAQARMGLGHAQRATSNEAAARLQFDAARAAFERIGAVHQAEAAAQAGAGAASAGAPRLAPSPRQTGAGRDGDGNVFRRDGDGWCLVFDATTVRLRDLKGLRYLARLLACPGRELHVLEMVAVEAGGDGDGFGADRVAEAGLSIRMDLDAGPWLDAQAKSAYRRRLAEIDEDLEAAQATGNDARAAQAEAERDVVRAELARAVGLGGRDRRAASVSERARASVTRAVRQAMARIDRHHPALGQHLQLTVRTGTYCAYRPDPRVATDWQL